ncbi:PKD domain-containing protein [Conexibacter sp. JD483]|uniref:PKD domain-containing protein n=1 Tax=unclassified Conexibacter TaxID=2627773 RepID=UPI0027256079|nr:MULTISPECIES: PKD domain-containing protein [unclassified Conexibacter]MDO8188660.1 PKD domain-containing protein [Conexibacter sp. CPCC 205706]MDO8199367.1 PKD domain-containing protein [Conexibacter sp. CPCC 205762]MDR9370833.1 PKD domain-containing protein [Conexibacter sp. JD483]
MLLIAAAVLTLVLTRGVDPAGAVITPATTIDASRDVVDFGDAAMAPDGTGAVVYRRLVGGVPHVFAARWSRSRWFAPVRVDGDSPYAASSPRIAAASGGRLLAVWTEAYATLSDGSVRYRLSSASLDPGASGFNPLLVVDGNVRAGNAIDPSVSITPTGRAFVAYRVVLGDQTTTAYTPLRDGDVLGEIRVAFLDGRTWSSAGVVNRNRSATMRKPNEQNGPQIAATPGGNAVVAWQEPDITSGVAHVYARRVFGARLGDVLAVSPDRTGDQPIAEDSDGIAVAVSPFGSAVVGFRVAAPASGGSTAAAQVMINRLPLEIEDGGARFTGARTIGSAPGGQLGLPAVALDGEDDFRAVFSSGPAITLVTGGQDSDPVAGQLGATPQQGSVAAAIDPSGGGTTAWASTDALGGPAVAVRQDFASGAFQTATVGADRSGPVNGLNLGSSGLGDAIVGFGQGGDGDVQIAATVVNAPPAEFLLRGPDGWVQPRRARVAWDRPVSVTGGLSYELAVDGIVRTRGLRRTRVTLDPRGLDDGAHQVQVIATDRSGQQTATSERRVRVDRTPPTAKVTRVRGKRRTVTVTAVDAASRVRAAATTIAWGDGTAATRGRARAQHSYARPGRYRIVVGARDRVGLTAKIGLEVTVR